MTVDVDIKTIFKNGSLSIAAYCHRRNSMMNFYTLYMFIV